MMLRNPRIAQYGWISSSPISLFLFPTYILHCSSTSLYTRALILSGASALPAGDDVTCHDFAQSVTCPFPLRVRAGVPVADDFRLLLSHKQPTQHRRLAEGHLRRRNKMQPAPNRLGLGMRQTLPSFGQGPSMGALAHQQQMLHHQQFSPPSKVVPIFVGSISGGISDAFLNDLLSVSSG